MKTQTAPVTPLDKAREIACLYINASHINLNRAKALTIQ